VTAHDGAGARVPFLVHIREKKFVALALMIPFAVIMDAELGQDSRQRAFSR
jgi:hypothetical protein